VCTFDPKPMEGDWNGTGADTDYSTKDMAPKEGGMKVSSSVTVLHCCHCVTMVGPTPTTPPRTCARRAA